MQTFFNKQCLNKNIVPNYANIKIPTTSHTAYTTQKKISSIRIEDEIKFLHMKKDKLNKQLYQIHLQAAQEWGNSWYIIRNVIHESVNSMMNKKYKYHQLKTK
jgi:hypothetical protein